MSLNARGSSILFVLIFIALMGIMIYVYMELFSQALINQRKVAAKIAFVDYVTSMRTLLNDAQTCETLLRGQSISATPGTVNRNSQNRNLVIGLGVPERVPGKHEIRAGNTTVSQLFEITEVVLSVFQNDIVRPAKLPPAPAPLTIPAPDGALRVLQYDRQDMVSHGPTGSTFGYANNFFTYKVRIQFNARLRNTLHSFYLNTMSDLHPEHWITLIVNVDASNSRIFTCHGLESIAEACESNGGAYDASTFMNTWPELRCHPANNLC